MSVYFCHTPLHSMRFIYFLFLVAYSVRENLSELISDETKAWEFLAASDEANYNYCMTGNEPPDLDMTIYNFAWQNFTDPVLKRAFNLTARINAVKEAFDKKFNSKDEERDAEIWNKMRSIYSSSKVCEYHGADKRNVDGNCRMLSRSEIKHIFYKIGNTEEREYYWTAWRDSVGKMRSIYDERMRVFKRLRVFPNYNDWWLTYFEEPTASIRQDMERVWKEIFPLYKELHAFIRRRLISVYGTTQINSNGPIPSHLLDLQTSAGWMINEVTTPYPEAKLNVTEMLKKNNMTTLDLFKLAEDFYHSLGLPLLDDNIWNISHFTENAHCESYYNYTCKSEIFSITACLPTIGFNLHRIIGLIDFYITNGKKKYKPSVLLLVPTPAFIPALGNAGELSSWTTDYLHQTGFIDDIPTSYGQPTAHDINLLMKVALRFLATIPYTYKIMKWRWDSFDFLISDNDYNRKWWEYSLEYQGICPPVRRTEEHFDPASSREVAMHLGAITNFIGIIYGFQFYKAACDEAGHKDLLHRCNLYGVKSFGDKIRQIIYLGKSIRWPEGISIMTNGKSVNMDTKPLLDYFQPLYEWLKKENEDETVGWQSNDPMVCPNKI